MSTRSTNLAALILLAATAATAGDALAQRTRADARESNRALADRSADRSHAGHRDERGDDHRALSAAVRRVERRTGGQVLSAERVPYDGRDINRIKVVDASGRVRVYVDDPRARAPQGRVRTRGDDN
ncbi:PepSY domain-containing protein [Novilysobacter erysipheiresistens]|uniref:PepSY domain-containing protein n=1 Tax=Novilysobacter erysipheiresistens TaxID=1749332 RepID=A0ABU7YZ26_9GAMM